MYVFLLKSMKLVITYLCQIYICLTSAIEVSFYIYQSHNIISFTYFFLVTYCTIFHIFYLVGCFFNKSQGMFYIKKNVLNIIYVNFIFEFPYFSIFLFTKKPHAQIHLQQKFIFNLEQL